MKQKTLKGIFLFAIAGGLVAVSLSTMARSGSRNRWESRMVKPEDPSQERKSTLNLNTGKKYNQDGTAAPAEAPAAASVLTYGAGTLHCRDGAVKLNTHFQSPNTTGVSEIRVNELNHNETRSYNCTSVTPTLISSDGIAVNAGTITIKCGNGQLHVSASNCTAPTPVPTPTPVAANPSGSPTPSSPVASGTPPAGSTTAACGSWCSDTTYRCRRSTGAKNGNIYSTTKYKICTNGQAYFTNSGTCGAIPKNCD
ncbi:hypothetical protein [Bdellovibrio sp. HCB337]|uniref:hypothetical protein n=1 Tax=Bdellovibrio sp. HCB337 TaxID=3394358 RepID=UPI0039A55DD1